MSDINNTNDNNLGQDNTENAAVNSDEAAANVETHSSKTFPIFFILILAAAGYAYYEGWLDKPLEQLKLISSNSTPATTKETTPAATTKETTPAATITTSSNNSAALRQIEAIQTRISSLENSVRNLKAIAEDHADLISRQSSSTGVSTSSGVSNQDFSNIQLELIDLRLRLNGDTIYAEQQLAALLTTINADTEIGKQINANRQRLTNITSRSQILADLDELTRIVKSTKDETNQKIAALNIQEDDKSWTAKLLNIKKDSPELRIELSLIDALLVEISDARPKLILGEQDKYLNSLESIQQAADNLRDQNQSINTTEISKVITNLNLAGFPEAFLLLQPFGNTNK